MKAETVDRLATAFEGAATRIGKGSKRPVGEVIEFLEWLLTILRRFESQERIRLDLQELEEPTAPVVSLVEGTLSHSPRLVGEWVNSKLKEALVRIKEGTQGRPEAISAEQRATVCDEISALERKGFALPQAKKLLAKKFGVHPRTVHRIWIDREKYPTGEQVSFDQALSFSTALFHSGEQQPVHEQAASTTEQ